MGDYLLRYEAGEFDATVYDGAQLSAIRGASLALLKSGRLVDRVIKNYLQNFEMIFSGASQAAYRFSAEEAEAKKVLMDVRAALRTDDEATGPHDHLAYVVDMVKCEVLVTALAEATALNDAQKLQGEGWPLPAFAAGASTFDAVGGRMRPADQRNYQVGGEKRDVSAAFKARHSFGYHARTNFYAEILEGQPKVEFVDDFHEMVANADVRLALSLQNKIGVFYADGNALGNLAEKALRESKLSEFSQQLKDHQACLMRAILDWRDKGQNQFNGQCWRFETLLWGGDEMCFVMPAWLALEFAEMFFKATEDWNVLGKKVTQAAGLVICSYKTPIRQAKTVAQELAELCKVTSKEESLLQIEVFESLSLPDTDIGKYRNKLYGVDGEKLSEQLAISGRDFTEFLDRLRQLKFSQQSLPRSQLYKLLRRGMFTDAARHVLGQSDKEIKEVYEKYRLLAGKGRSPDEKALHVIKSIKSNGDISLYLQLGMISMLWDYVDPIILSEGQS